MIEIANMHDVKGIVDLVNSESEYLISRTEEEVQKHIGNFVVVRENDNVIACAAFENYSPKIAEIRSVVVHPDYRGRGYAKELIETLMRRARTGQEVFVVTSKADYFKKLGFHTEMNEKQFLVRIK